MEKGSPRTVFGRGSGGPKLTGEGRVLNAASYDEARTAKGNWVNIPSLRGRRLCRCLGAETRGFVSLTFSEEKSGEANAAPRPVVQKGGNTNELGNARANPGGRFLFSLTDVRPRNRIGRRGGSCVGQSTSLLLGVQCVREGP